MRKEKGGCRQACPLFSFVLSGFNRLKPMFWKFLCGFDTCTLPDPAFVAHALLGLAERNGSGLSVESAEELPESVTCVVRGLIEGFLALALTGLIITLFVTAPTLYWETF